MLPLEPLYVSHQFLPSREKTTFERVQWFSSSELKQNVWNVHCAGFLVSGIKILHQ